MKKFILILSLLGFFGLSKANNIIIQNGKIKGKSTLSLNASGNAVDVAFDLSWNNSYRTGTQKVTTFNISNIGSGMTSAPLVYIDTTGSTVWSSGQSYTLGQMIVIATRVYIVTLAGTSGTAGPTATTPSSITITNATGGTAKYRYVNTVSALRGGGSPTGSGARAKAIVSGGLLRNIILTNAGSNYNTTPLITFGQTVSPNIANLPAATAVKEDFYDAAWVFLKFRVAQDYISPVGATDAGTTITVNSTKGLRKGMPVTVLSGSGAFDDTTIVTQVVDAQTFIVNRAPISSLGSNTVIKGMRVWEHGYLTATGHTIGTPNSWASSARMKVGLMNEENTTSLPMNNQFDPAAPFSFNPAVGLFYYPSPTQSGTGNFQLFGATLRWNYAANGLTDNQSVDIMVYGVEMCLIPPGSFYLGDGNSDNAQFASSSGTPFLVPTEIASGTLGGGSPFIKTFTGGAGFQSTGDDFNNFGSSQTLPAEYPKGFNGIFVMKYEMGQRQYKEFFNTLSPLQKTFHDISGPDGKNSDALVSRNAFAWNSSNTSSDAYLLGDAYGDVACNFLSWADGVAYADWSGLRPMSEMEFEVAARGNGTPSLGEYAWGHTGFTPVAAVSNAGQKNELVTTAGANVNYGNGFSGPIRVGAMATSTTPSKDSCGAGHYGIMELSGNLWERCVSVGNANGRSFRRIQGDGILDEYGYNNVPYTPNATASGTGFRGGSYKETDPKRLRTSDRFRAAEIQSGRGLDWGFRCVRNLPASPELQ